MDALLLIIAIVLGFIGFVMMLIAFAFVILRGGWNNAMTAEGCRSWSLPRALMVIGAFLGVAHSLLVVTVAYML